MQNQWRAKKTLAMYENDIKASGLKKILGKWSLTSLGVGCIIGAGIFVMTGLAAREYAGPALAISFVIAGLGCTFAALCYAEFASMIPVEGSAYSYSYATMGELFAWIIGWDLIIEYSMASATVAVGWSGYFLKFLGLFHVHLPLWLVNDIASAKSMVAEATSNGKLDELNQKFSSLEIPNVMGIDIAMNLPSFLVCLLITYVLYRGIKSAVNTNLTLVILKVSVILFVIVTGAFFVDATNWSPFIPVRTLNSQGNMSFGFAGILTGAAYVCFAYLGFDAVATQAGEAKNPRKDIPFAILVSLSICTFLYILVTLVVTGMVKYSEIDITAPIADAFGRFGLSFSVWIISLAAVAGLTSVLLVNMLAQSRLFLAMSNDGLLPKKFFGKLHSKYKTPYIGTVLTGLAVAFTAGFVPMDVIAKLVNIGTLFAFTMVCMAVMVMRYKQPTVNRPFRVPFVMIIAPLGILFNLSLMFSLELENWVRLFVWLALGLVIYFIYSQRHSVLGKTLKAEVKTGKS
ncbi:amino acid permease [soil metagenome]